jgi:hypothetical protein
MLFSRLLYDYYITGQDDVIEKIAPLVPMVGLNYKSFIVRCIKINSDIHIVGLIYKSLP